MISEPSAHRSQAPVLSADPESDAITTLGADLVSPPKVSKNTPCILVAERARWLRTPDLVDICISRFEWRPTDIVSWPPSKGHLLIPTRLRMAGLDRCPIFAASPRYFAVAEIPREAASIGHRLRPAIRRRVGIKRCPLEVGQLTVLVGRHQRVGQVNR